MGKRVVAMILMLAMAVQAIACGKPSDSGKETTKQPYGYKRYTCYEGIDGSGSVKKVLKEEFEDLGTERTCKLYSEDDGSVYGIDKWYFDRSGKYLLKKVVWRYYSPTECFEYDTKGRLIRYSIKVEDGLNELYPDYYFSLLSIPEVYFSYTTKTGLNLPTVRFRLDRSVKELVTEYTYKGDTGSYSKLRTIDDRGCEVCEVELGDEDIVLHAIISTPYAKYAEEYIPGNDGTAMSEGIYASDDNDEQVYIEKEYDQQGRCVKVSIRETYGGENDTLTVHVYEYDNDHYMWFQTVYSGEDGPKLTNVQSSKVDYDNRVLCSETQYYDDQEKLHYAERSTYTYFKGDQVKTSLHEYSFYGPSTGYEKDYERTYNEDGETVEYIYYSSDEQIREYSWRTDIKQEQTAIGTVRHYKEYTFDGEVISEYDKVYLPASEHPYEMDWLTFSRISYSYGEQYETVVATYAKNGKLKRVEYLDSGYSSVEDARSQGYVYFEFDEKGRTVVHGYQYSPFESYREGTGEYDIWEYWDGKKPD
ncbi:MAG: hypothetical protein J5532_07305 [Lachnospiraceae bacterium]|nr:hypothetical protein [Lachnospiraceae bacterium]